MRRCRVQCTACLRWKMVKMLLNRCRRLPLPAVWLAGSTSLGRSRSGRRSDERSGLELDFFFGCSEWLVASSSPIEFCRNDGGREITISRPFSPAPLNMLCRLSRPLLTAEALRRLARSMNAAPVELDRLDKLPKDLPPFVGGFVGDMVLDRQTFPIDIPRLPPVVTSCTGASSSRSVGLSLSFFAIAVVPCLDAGEAGVSLQRDETVSP